MSEIQEQQLHEFLRGHPRLPYVTPSSPDYPALRMAYILGNPAVPLAICRPQNAEDVSLLISYATSNGIDITVRAGGHDLFGRCYSQDAIAIDLRDISYVAIDQSNCSALIGGGILAGELATKLSRHGLTTSFGSASTVGYVGWSIYGGYGPFVANYGLGVDQILGAIVVNSEGQIVEADENMLEAIRGAGGSVGVIVELKIKVYPLEQVLGGVLVYKSENLISTIKKFTTGYLDLAEKGLPDALGIQRSIVNTPTGKAFAAGFVWSSDDLDLGLSYLRQFTELGEVVLNTVVRTTVQEWMEISAQLIPKVAYGGICTISLRELTDEVLTIIGQEINNMPTDSATLFSVHHLRGQSAAPKANSVFGARSPHYMIEFIATSSTQEQGEIAWEWGTSFREALRKTDAANILPESYISLTPPGDANFPMFFGAKWQRLVKIKKQYDPHNVFRKALAQFDGA